ncbi:hypothetical protein GCM10010329_41950 [Streptomyces spiroverticillatus]|uniref:Uncharacterized protein n=1 Tax=Streptomyces finlayi TaxID=67296 RepID=A0A919CAP0_9ACTN|nr:hypothetical protein [Streptomyces finlayi]GHA14633.1 hypothetical protein GCM10010329_41950 [Streptomyces spiroverticillatus]GHC97208.1 hypothetical protein GCM10010334_38290 [Streptomyces finlayi]
MSISTSAQTAPAPAPAEYFESVTVHRAGRKLAVTMFVSVLAMVGWTVGMIYTISGWISGH